MIQQPPEMRTFVIWDYELEELTYGDRLDTKKQLNKDVRSRSHTASKSEREIREDERERVLDEIKAWVGSDRETCHRIGAIPAMLPHACVIDLVERMRRQHQEAGP